LNKHGETMAGRILVADDNPDTVELLELSLRAGGWQVSAAATVGEARTLIAREAFDLIILDSWLPDGDGVEFCRELRTYNPHLPILFLSAAAYPTDISGAKEAGCNAYLVKPCHLDQLIGAVQVLIGAGLKQNQASR